MNVAKRQAGSQLGLLSSLSKLRAAGYTHPAWPPPGSVRAPRQCRRCQSSSYHQPERSSPVTKRTSRFVNSRTFTVVFILATAGVLFSTLSAPSDESISQEVSAREQHRRSLNLPPEQPIFYPFTVISKENLSPTSFLLTVREEDQKTFWGSRLSGMKHAYLLPRDGQWLWKYPMWSVDIKEPNVQIARHFTPLPPLAADSTHGGPGEDPTDGILRFYIRSMPGGEMSRYLDRLQPGDRVEMRGPHPGFDLTHRLGASGRHLVFLAGGTGLAPGMQAAAAALNSHPQSEVTLLWAVRTQNEAKGLKEDSLLDNTSRKQSFWWSFARPRSGGESSAQSAPSESTIEAETPLIRHLNHLKDTYGTRLHIRVAVDSSTASNSSFSDTHIQHALSSSVRPASPLSSREDGSPLCPLHTQALQRDACEADEWRRQCHCPSPDSQAPDTGKNILMISGPEGFITKYAGSKVWKDGRERQGPLGGVVGGLMKEQPDLAKTWLVLKL